LFYRYFSSFFLIIHSFSWFLSVFLIVFPWFLLFSSLFLLFLGFIGISPCFSLFFRFYRSFHRVLCFHTALSHLQQFLLKIDSFSIQNPFNNNQHKHIHYNTKQQQYELRQQQPDRGTYLLATHDRMPLF